MNRRYFRITIIDNSIRLSIMTRESNRISSTVCASIYMSDDRATRFAIDLLDIINKKKLERVEKSK